MKPTWKPFNGNALCRDLGCGCEVIVRAQGRPDTLVVINQFGQPIVKDTGTLLPWDPAEACVPDDAALEKPAKETPAKD